MGKPAKGIKIRFLFYIEPTSAAATAGLSQLINKGIIKPTDSTVVILTGFGLKATDKIKILKNKE